MVKKYFELFNEKEVSNYIIKRSLDPQSNYQPLWEKIKNKMIKFLDIYNQDKNLHSKILIKLKNCLERVILY